MADGDEVVVDEATGEKYLVQHPSVTEEWVNDGLEDTQAAYEEYMRAKLDAVQAKAESSAAAGLPPEKSPL